MSLRAQVTELRSLLEGAETAEVEAAAKRLRESLAPVFDGFFFEVVAERGVTAEFARTVPDAGPLKRLHAPAYVKLILVPSDRLSPSWKPDSKLNVKLADERSAETLGNLKLSFRKAIGVENKKGVDLVIRWFEKNADALRGGGPDQW